MNVDGLPGAGQYDGDSVSVSCMVARASQILTRTNPTYKHAVTESSHRGAIVFPGPMISPQTGGFQNQRAYDWGDLARPVRNRGFKTSTLPPKIS